VNDVSLEMKGDYGTFEDNGERNTQFREDFLLPLAGRRDKETGVLEGTNAMGRYYSSSPIVGNVCYIALSQLSIWADSTALRTWGYPVRCFKDVPNPSVVSVTYDPASPTLSNEVTVTLTFDQTGSMVEYGRTATGGWQKVYTANTTETVHFLSERGGVVSVEIIVDNVEPTPPTPEDTTPPEALAIVYTPPTSTQ
jgi:hypothetical protein